MIELFYVTIMDIKFCKSFLWIDLFLILNVYCSIVYQFLIYDLYINYNMK